LCATVADSPFPAVSFDGIFPVAFFGGHLVEVPTPDESKYIERLFLTDTVAERATNQCHNEAFEAGLGSEPELFYRIYPNW